MPQKGNCSFCNSQDVDIIDPKLLLDYFELLINIYEINPEGKNLVEWLKACFPIQQWTMLMLKSYWEKFSMTEI